ncbi:hypothetical protein KAI87_09760 [Myxococcota bacterium]|nr:hypothetical protein [Myxococcota bacterium]
MAKGISGFFGFMVIVWVLLSGACTKSTPGGETYLSFFQAHQAELPEGTRLPAGEDLSYWGTDRNTVVYKTEDDEGNRKEPWWTKGDFNGDGTIDRAYIVFREGQKDAEVIAFVSGEGRYTLENLGGANKTMGVATCKDRISDRSVLAVFEFEGHGWLFRWNDSLKRFDEIKENAEEIHCRD